MLAILVLALSAAFTTAARSGATLHGHMVQSIPLHTKRDINSTDAAVAVFAFYASGSCEGTPAFLHAENISCYGPVARTASFQLISLKEDCQALARYHPCGSDDSAFTILKTDNTCWQAATAAHDIDVWVQCGLPSVYPERFTGEEPPPIDDQSPVEPEQPPVESTLEAPPPVKSTPVAPPPVESFPAGIPPGDEQPPMGGNARSGNPPGGGQPQRGQPARGGH